MKTRLDNNRGERLKRKAQSPQADPTTMEDLNIKKRMLELWEENSRRNTENIQQLNQNIATISSTIHDGFALMRELLTKQTPRSQNFEQCNGYSFSQSPLESSTPSPTYLQTPHTISRQPYFSHSTLTGRGWAELQAQDFSYRRILLRDDDENWKQGELEVHLWKWN